MSGGRPGDVNFPDLSGLDDKLTVDLVLSMTVGRAFPPGDAQHLVTAFVRTTEGALRRYEEARLQLELAVANDSLASYFRGLDDMEIALVAVHRAMRLAEALKTSTETLVGNGEIPPREIRDRLRKMRNAVDHRDGPIVGGLAGVGKTLALDVGEREMTIDDADGTHTMTHEELGELVRDLHRLAVELTNYPERWFRPAT